MTSFPLRLAALLVLALAAQLTAESRYVVDVSDRAAGVLNIELYTRCTTVPCKLKLPAWNAVYRIRNYSQHVFQLEARSPHGAALSVRKTGPSSWEVERGADDDIVVRYRVRADRDGPFGAFASPNRISLNLGQLLLYGAAQRNAPAHLSFAGVPNEFGEALALPRREGGYWAPSYDRLIDTPALLANFEEASFDVSGKTVRVVVHGPAARSKLSGLKSNARRIVRAATTLMGDAPFESYTFVYVFTSRGGGGMEFRDGTMIFGRTDCPNCGMDELTAHEFFHLWNVKRIRPQSMEPVDWSRPVPSPTLWFAEGASSAYARFLQTAAGLADGDSLLRRFEDRLNEYQERPARLTQSAEESSIDAWLEGDPVYHRPDRSVSYYLQGELIAYLLDLEIRGRTNNERSLDDVFRGLNEDYAQQGRLFDDSESLLREASRAAGSDMTSVFDELVRTASDIDWERYLHHAGLRLEGVVETGRDPGLSLANPPAGGIVVSAIDAGGAAEAAGVRVGDRIEEIDGGPIVGSAAEASQRLRAASPVNIPITVERDGLRLRLVVRLTETSHTVYRVVSLAQTTEVQRQIRDGWLNRTTSDSSKIRAYN